MNIEELTPEYIFNKLEKGFKSNNLSNIDLSVGNMDIRTIEKTVPEDRSKSFFIVERVSTNRDWDDCIYGLDYYGLCKCNLHNDFYILNFAGGGFKSRAVKKKKDRKGWCEKICMEIISRSYGVDYYAFKTSIGYTMTVDRLREELKVIGNDPR